MIRLFVKSLRWIFLPDTWYSVLDCWYPIRWVNSLSSRRSV